MQYTISALVANKSGVLTRISGLFARRGYNIDSLSVCATEDKKISRMTIVLNGDEYTLEQLTKQLSKLVDVKNIMHIQESAAIFRELLLVKLSASEEKRSKIIEICNIYRGKIDDLKPESLVVEITGPSVKLDAFIEMIKPYGILEMARTGATAITRGDVCIKDVENYNESI